MERRTVIFDMDGVLVDTELLYLKGFIKTMEDYGFRGDEELFLSMAGKGLEEKFLIVKERLGFDVPLEQAVAHYRRVRRLPDDYAPYKLEGLDETLRSLKNMGCQMAVASNSGRAHIERILESCGIKEYFCCIASGTEIGKRKPDPAVYLSILDKLKISRDSCLAVEDSDTGIEAAARAGIRVAARRDPRFGFCQEKADWRIERLTELVDIINHRKAGGSLCGGGTRNRVSEHRGEKFYE